MEVLCNALGNKTRYQLIKAMKEHTIGSCCDRIEFFENGISVGDVVNFTYLINFISVRLYVSFNGSISATPTHSLSL